MAEPVAVKRALARLASGADADRAVVVAADTAVDDLDAAVAFAADVGVPRLAVAVERQRAAGNADVVARGERALRAFRRYRRAAATTPGEERARGGDDGEPTDRDGDTSGSASGSGSAPAAGWRTLDGDHFHCGDGTDLRAGRKLEDR